MLMTKSNINRTFTLYRGESPDALPELKEGLAWHMRMSPVQRRSMEMERLCLSCTSPETMLFEAKSIIRAHILSRRRSPFVSFTGKERVAMGYAAGGGARERGLIVRAEVKVCREIAWEPFNVAGLYIDHADRLWLHVPVYWPMFKTEMYEPRFAEAFRRSYRDDEYLLLGDLGTEEFEVRKV